MGGSGGGGYFTPRELERLRAEARDEIERSRNEAEINQLLQAQLQTINDRDVDQINLRLDQIMTAAEEEGIEFDRLIFGGSVAKHTYVNGLSDVDALLVLPDGSQNYTPEEAKAALLDALRRALPQRDIAALRSGTMAVTVTYRDGLEIQLLPAISGAASSPDQIAVASSDGNGWSTVHPKAFAQALTDANRQNGGALVPAIKLVKAIVESQLGDTRPTGYQVEALAVEIFRHYEGRRTPKAMVETFFNSASERVLAPIRDRTGQSVHVDDELGGPDSVARRNMAESLAALAHRVSSAKTTDQWNALLG